MDPRNYSVNDLKLYYDRTLVYSKKAQGLIEIRGFAEAAREIYAICHQGYHHLLPDLDDDPKIGVLGNGKAGAYFLTRTADKQFRKGTNQNNTKLNHVVAWGGNYVNELIGRTTFKTQVRPFFAQINYPPIQECPRILQTKLSVAFAPKFALAIPLAGADPVVTRMKNIIGHYKGDKVYLNPRVKHYKEELEQYVEVIVK